MSSRHSELVLEILRERGPSRAEEVGPEPIDRLIVAQAQALGIPIVTADPAIARYEVESIW